MYNFNNIEEKNRIYKYWNHYKSGEPICEIIKENLNENFIFCEIGCQLAGLSDLILNEFGNSKVYSIDIKNCNPKRIEEMRLEFNNRFKFILGSSLETYDNFEDNYFDMIYIDTSPHIYEQLKNEIDVWIPKVKKGGVVSFHDYNHNAHPGVKICIDEYCHNNNLELYKKDYYNVYFILKY